MGADHVKPEPTPDPKLAPGVVIPEPGSPGTVIKLRRPAPVVVPPVHHTQGAKTIPGPVLTEPER
jgi:hypothetical protein